MRDGYGVDADEDRSLRYAGDSGRTELQEGFKEGLEVNFDISVLVHCFEAMSAVDAQMRVDAGADNGGLGLADCSSEVSG